MTRSALFVLALGTTSVLWDKAIVIAGPTAAALNCNTAGGACVVPQQDLSEPLEN